MRRILILLALMATALGVSVTAATAAANFHGTPTATINGSGQLVCSGDVSGLGNATSTTASCTATSQATYQCINRGGNHPQAGNKETVTGTVSDSQDVPVRNGRAQATIILNPTGPGSFSCPGGQTLFLVGVCYTDITFELGGLSSQPADVCRTDLMIRA